MINNKLKWLGLLLILIIVGGISLTYANINNIKEQFEHRFESYGLTVEVLGKVRIGFFPWPHLNFTNVIINDNEKNILRARSIRFGYSLNPIDISKKSFVMRQAEINVDNLFNFLSTVQNEILEKDDYKITTLDSKLIIGPRNELLDVKAKLMASGNAVSIVMDSNYKNVFSNLEIKYKKQSEQNNITARLKSNDFNIDFRGESVSLFEKNKFIVSGEIITKFSDFNFLTSWFDLDKNMVQKIKGEDFNLKAKLELGDILSLTDIEVKSKSIDSLQGNIKFLSSANNEIEFTGKKVDIDGFIGKDGVGELQSLLQTLLQNFNFEIPKRSIRFNLDLGQLIFRKQNVNNFKLSANVENNTISIDGISMDLPGDSSMEVQGFIKHNNIRPKFDGEVVLISNDFDQLCRWLGMEGEIGKKMILKSNLSIIPHRLRLFDTKAGLDHYLFAGHSYIKQTRRSDGFSVYSNYSINGIDLDKYKLGESIQHYLVELAEADIDKSGEKFFTNVNDFKFLRKLTGTYELNLSVPSVLLNGYTYNNLYLNLRLSQGNLDLQNISFESKYLDLEGYVRISVPRIKPNVNSAFRIKRFNEVYFKEAGWDYNALVSNAKENLKQEKGSEVVVAEFNVFGLGNFEGNIIINADEFSWGSIDLENLKLTLVISAGVINVVDGTASFASGGDVDINGNIVLLSVIPSVNVNYAFNNINPASILYIIVDEKDYMTGYLSMSGAFSTSGINYQEWLRNLSGRGSFIGKKMYINGFDIAEMVRVPEVNLSYSDKLKRLEYYEHNSKSYLENLSGDFTINSGIVNISNVSFDNSRVSGVFVGNYSIFERAINSRAKFSFFPIGSSITVSTDISSSGKFSERKTVVDNKELKDYLAAVEERKLQESRIDSQKAQSLLRSRRR